MCIPHPRVTSESIYFVTANVFKERRLPLAESYEAFLWNIIAALQILSFVPAWTQYRSG